MPAWALKLSALFITLFVLIGSFDYARGHLKNPAAPLQPPVADAASPVSTTTPAPSVGPTIGPLLTIRPGQRTASATPGPRLTLAPGVQTASLAPITLTHTS